MVIVEVCLLIFSISWGYIFKDKIMKGGINGQTTSRTIEGGHFI